MSCDAVTSSRATQLASTHGRWTFESQLACRVRRVGQRRMRDHEAPASLRPDAARSQPRGSRLMSLSKVTEIGLIICTVYSVVCPCAQPQGARPLRHRGRTGYCARCGRVTFIFRRKIRLLAVVTITVTVTKIAAATRARPPYATTRTPPCRAQPWDGVCWYDSVTLSHVRRPSVAPRPVSRAKCVCGPPPGGRC